MNPQNPYQQPSPQNQQPVQQPEVYNSPTLAGMPYGAQPAPQPQSTVTSTPLPSTGKKRSKGPIIIGIVAGIMLILVVLAVVLQGGGKDNDANKPASPESTTTPQALQPATSIELQQVDNSLSQDLSALDDEKDFPNASLDDKTLGL